MAPLRLDDQMHQLHFSPKSCLQKSGLI